jgi:uncharacterized protein DUF5670
MLFKTGCILLILWVVGATGLYDVGQLVHVLLLVGMMLLLLALVRARDAAAKRGVNQPSEKA